MTDNIINLWQNIATTSIGIIVTMVGYWLTFGRNMITKEEAVHMIETLSPYARDREMIFEKLAVNKETQAQFSFALQRNSDVMNELKIQIATLTKTLEAIESRIERS